MRRLGLPLPRRFLLDLLGMAIEIADDELVNVEAGVVPETGEDFGGWAEFEFEFGVRRGREGGRGGGGGLFGWGLRGC